MKNAWTLPDPESSDPRISTHRQHLLWTGLKLVSIVLGSRLWFFGVGRLAYRWLPHALLVTPPGFPVPIPWTSFTPWANWDGLWYLSIAQWGYAGRPAATAFFPLYPLMVRLVGHGIPGAVILSCLLLTLAVVLLYALCRLEWGEKIAWATVLALAFFPTSFYFNAAYPESLFLVLSLGSVYAARRSAWALAGILGALASLCSIYGILLAIPMALLLWRTERRFSPSWLWIGIIPAGLAGYLFYLAARFGNPLLFFSVQAEWGRHLTPIWTTMAMSIKSLHTAWETFVFQPSMLREVYPSLAVANINNFFFAVAGLALLLLAIGRLPGYLWFYAAISLAIPLSDPSRYEPLMSMPRLLLDIFPLFPAIGLLSIRFPSFSRLYYVMALPIGAILTALFVTGHWVA